MVVKMVMWRGFGGGGQCHLNGGPPRAESRVVDLGFATRVNSV